MSRKLTLFFKPESFIKFVCLIVLKITYFHIIKVYLYFVPTWFSSSVQNQLKIFKTKQIVIRAIHILKRRVMNYLREKNTYNLQLIRIGTIKNCIEKTKYIICE